MRKLKKVFEENSFNAQLRNIPIWTENYFYAPRGLRLLNGVTKSFSREKYFREFWAKLDDISSDIAFKDQR